MKVRVQILKLSPADIKRLRIAAGFNSALDAARFFGVPDNCWYRWETGFKKPQNAAFIYWSLVGAALGIREEIDIQAIDIPKTEDFPSVRSAIERARDEERQKAKREQPDVSAAA